MGSFRTVTGCTAGRIPPRGKRQHGVASSVTSHQKGQSGRCPAAGVRRLRRHHRPRPGDNDWVLPDDKRFISSRHALIDFQAGAYYLVDTSRNGVYINGADTAVGRGHPQRLFDGDKLRLGEYEIAVEVSAGDEQVADDGMRDSVVRAQLVPVDESIEMKLVDESKMRAFEYNALEKMTRASDPDSSSPARKAPSAAATAKAAKPAKPAAAGPLRRRRPLH